MSGRVLHDVMIYTNTDFTDPYQVCLFVWMSLSCAFNIAVITKASRGWLINKRITMQVIVASSVAIIWISMFLIQFFVQHRAISIITTWTGTPLTLLIALQHIELLKLFVTLSDFWTVRKCQIFQIAIIVTHVFITVPNYIWPLGMEGGILITQVKMIDRSFRT